MEGKRKKKSGRQKVREKPSVCPQVIVTRRWPGMSFYLCESVSVSDHCLWHLFFRCLSLPLLNRISSPPSSVFTQFNSRFFHVPRRVSLSLPVELGRKEIDERETQSEKERKKEKVNVVTSWCYPSLLIMSNDPPSLLILYWEMIHRLLIPSSPKSLSNSLTFLLWRSAYREKERKNCDMEQRHEKKTIVMIAIVVRSLIVNVLNYYFSPPSLSLSHRSFISILHPVVFWVGDICSLQ